MQVQDCNKYAATGLKVLISFILASPYVIKLAVTCVTALHANFTLISTLKDLHHVK